MPAASAVARRAVARRAFADARAPVATFALLFALVAYAQPTGYRNSYATAADRLAFARSVGNNAAVRLFYGEPRDLLTVQGYAAWRVGGILAIAAGVWGALAAVRALRGEEEAGRLELVLSGIVGRAGSYAATLAAIGAGAAVLWAAMLAGLAGGGLPVAGSAYLALATVTVAAVFVGVGALASQLVARRRTATGASLAALLGALMLRVAADTTAGLEWLRWATPLGWAEELRPFTGARPAVLLLPLAATALLLSVAGRIATRRDVGAGIVPSRDSAAPRMRLLGGPTALALRLERGTLAGWIASVGAFALVLGIVSDSVASAISHRIREELARVGATSLATASGYLGLTFLFFVLAISLFGCAQVGAVRREEADQRLETVLAAPMDRRAWLGGRLLLAGTAAAALALVAGILAWAGAASQGAAVSLPRLLEAGLNCLPVALLFLGVAALCFSLAPRTGTAIAYALVALAFVWELFGALLGAPGWALNLSPFHHVGLVPAQSFRAGAAAGMLALAAAAALAAVGLFARRDLTGA